MKMHTLTCCPSVCACCVILGASKWGRRLEKLWRNRGRNLDLEMSGSCTSVAEYLHTKCCTDGSRPAVCSPTAAGWGETEDLTTVCGGRVTEESMPTYGYSGTGPTPRCGLSGLFLQSTTTLKYQWMQFCLWWHGKQLLNHNSRFKAGGFNIFLIVFLD